MPGIFVMGTITLIVSALFWGGMVYLFSGRNRSYLWLLVLGLPLSWIVNNYIKTSAALFVGQAAGIPQGLGLDRPAWFTFFLFMLSPVMEELIKVVPLLLPWARRLVKDPASAFWTGITLGVSFGLGEVVFVGYAVARTPLYADLPWYAFTGFLGERFMICFFHGLTTAVFVLGLQRGGKSVLAAFLAAMLLHAVANTGPMLYQLGFFPTWITSLWEVSIFILTAYLFERFRRMVTSSSGAMQAPGEVVYWTRASS